MIDQDAVIRRLVADEGKVRHAYQDHMSYWTIGVGRLIDERRGGGLSDDEIMYLLRNDIASKTAQLQRRFNWFDAVDSVRQQALICMAFQLGVNGVANFKKMIAALKIRDYNTASIEALNSGWAKQTPARAERMARILRTGEWE